MKLYHSPASPFVRKTLAAAHETGLAERIEIATIALTPVAGNAALNRENPIGKIPALVLEDGPPSSTPASSASTSTPGTTAPPLSGGRTRALDRAPPPSARGRAPGRGDPLPLRDLPPPEERRWADWIDGQRAKLRRALDALDGEADAFGGTVDIGTIAAACAADYLDFRSIDDGWRDRRPRLAGWLETFAARPSMQATRPTA